MKLMTISEVTKTFHVTTRMLRYYDEIGLLPSTRKEDYAYRVYDEAAVRRLQQILTLRKLRIPLKKIALIFDNSEQMKIVEVFQESVNELDGEISALQTIRDILRLFIMRLNSAANAHVKLDMLDDAEIMSVVSMLSLSKINFREEHSMDDLNKANEALSKLTDVRILHLPPCTVAASHFMGKNPELSAGKQLTDFIVNNNLYQVKPDARVFGFNHSNPSAEREEYGYEFWVTIPHDMQVPEPFQKKHFEGGLYAAHMIQMNNFHEWEWLAKWVGESPKYEANYSHQGEEIMSGCLEEHLNFVYNVCGSNVKGFDNEVQLDLLVPIKAK